MADKTMPISVPSEKPIKLVKWKIKQGAFVSQGQILFLYSDSSGKSDEIKKFKAVRAGTILCIKVKEGDVVEPGLPVAELEECRHPTVMKDMCAECGADLRTDERAKLDVAVVPMVHSVPELKVSEELAQKLGKEDAERLLKDRKLVLLVDLDQTLVHTTNDNVPPNLKDVLHFYLRGGGAGRWCHTRLRPHTARFLSAAARRYELHVVTFGARQYAHAVTELLDPEKKYFSHRILSRDECFDPRTKAANLKALFPCGDNMVCIIDDREDVWRHAHNLIHVRPYSFFQSTGDINAPPAPDVEEKSPKLSSGKNGAQPVIHQMPMLDDEPDPRPEKPDLKPDKPDSQPDKPDSRPDKPDSRPDKPDSQPDKPDSRPDKPDSRPDKPDSQPDKPDSRPDKPDSRPDKPDSQPDKPDSRPDKPDSRPDKPDSQPDKPDSRPDKPDSRPDKPDSRPDKPDSQPDKPDSRPDKKEDGDNGKILARDEPATNVTVPGEETESPEELSEPEPKWVETADGQIEVEDPDDYLIYLEDILNRIHTHFYDVFDKTEGKQIPDLKAVIPEVKSKVLSGCSLVFSGLVPTHQRLDTARAFLVARSLGADVTQDFTDATTHLVAVRSGTAKVNSSRKLCSERKLHVVTPSWLWSCAERWERVDERLYPLQRTPQSSSRRPPAHCSSPPPLPPQPAPAPRRRTPSGRFMDTLNPLLSFSSDDIADMDREVEDIFNESDESSSDEEAAEAQDDDLDDEENPPEDRLLTLENDDSSQERLQDTLENDDDSDTNLDGDMPRRKRARPSTPPSDDDEPPDDEDSSWRLMGAALEREFLAQD